VVDLAAEVVVETEAVEAVGVDDVVPAKTRKRNGFQSPNSAVLSVPERSSPWR
jgi:hypothetical protein